jgi:hypothetical protein
VQAWLNANLNEVVTILIVNFDDLPPTSYGSIYSSMGLDNISYAPPASSLPASAWPTLGDMINASKRLVTFMDFEANFGKVDYIIDGESCASGLRREQRTRSETGERDTDAFGGLYTS